MGQAVLGTSGSWQWLWCRYHYLGSFTDEVAAARAFDTGAVLHREPAAQLNFPEDHPFHHSKEYHSSQPASPAPSTPSDPAAVTEGSSAHDNGGDPGEADRVPKPGLTRPEALETSESEALGPDQSPPISVLMTAGQPALMTAGRVTGALLFLCLETGTFLPY